MKGSKRIRKKKAKFPNIPSKYILKNGMLTEEALIKIFGVEEETYKKEQEENFKIL